MKAVWAIVQARNPQPEEKPGNSPPYNFQKHHESAKKIFDC